MKNKSNKAPRKLFTSADSIADTMDNQALQLERAYESLMDTVNRLKHKKATRRSPVKLDPQPKTPEALAEPGVNIRGLVKQELMDLLKEVA